MPSSVLDIHLVPVGEVAQQVLGEELVSPALEVVVDGSEPSTIEKTAVFAPTPSAIVTTAATPRAG
jgi:hypothetical protein